MLIDLLATDNLVSYNVKIANVLGLHTAVYLTELINISLKAEMKQKLIANKYFVVDRKYITRRTTLEAPEQIAIEEKLKKVDVIQKPADSVDTIYLNVDKLGQIISSDDDKYLQKVSTTTKVKTVALPGMKQTLRQKEAIELKNHISTTHEELRAALEGWIDGVYANPKGFLSKRAISIFEKTVSDFSAGDLSVALKLIDIATVGGYRDAQWAINDYKSNPIHTALSTVAKRVVALDKTEVF